MNNRAVLMGAAALVLASCAPLPPKVTSKDATEAIKDCASSDAVPGSAIRYTGPVSVGPGAEWTRLAGSFFKPDSFVPYAPVSAVLGEPLPRDLYAPSAALMNCQISGSGTVDLKAAFGADLKQLPLSSELSTELSSGTVVSVNADGFQWDWVYLGVYNNALAKLDAKSPFRVAVTPLEVAVGMLRVKNYVAVVDVTRVTGVDFSAKYNGPLSTKLTGNLTATVNAKYDGKGHLELTIPAETYVAGLFREIKNGAVQSAAPSAEPPVDWTVKAVNVRSRGYDR